MTGNATLAIHLRTRLSDGRAIVRSIEERRVVARVVLTIGREAGLLTFAVPLTHGHFETSLPEREAKKFLRDVEAALRRRLRIPVPFEQYEPEPIRDQRHLRNAFDYINRQHLRHEVGAADPRCEGTALPDLLGLRPMGRYLRGNAEGLLGPLDEGRLWELIGAPGLHRAPPLPWSDAWLPAAAAAAACLPHLRGRSEVAIAARCAAIEVGLGAGLSLAQLGDLLDVPPRTRRWLRQRPVDVGLTRAIRGQLQLAAAKAAIGESAALP